MVVQVVHSHELTRVRKIAILMKATHTYTRNVPLNEDNRNTHMHACKLTHAHAHSLAKGIRPWLAPH